MNELVGRYQAPVFNFAARMAGNRQNAEDITQETFIKVLKSLPAYKPKNFKSYIYRIARNTVLDHLRKKKSDVSIETEIAISEDDSSELKNLIPDMVTPTPEQSFINSETEETISLLLMRIPFEQRQVFIMREFSEMSFKEIAGACGCSRNTVLSRMQYCLKKLKEMLKEIK